MIKEGMTEKDFNNLSLYCQEHGVRTVVELKQVQQLCKEVGITNVDELADFFEVEGLMDETPLDALKRYRTSLGDDYQLDEATLSTVEAANKSADAIAELASKFIENIEEALAADKNVSVDISKELIAELEKVFRKYTKHKSQSEINIENELTTKLNEF